MRLGLYRYCADWAKEKKGGIDVCFNSSKESFHFWRRDFGRHSQELLLLPWEIHPIFVWFDSKLTQCCQLPKEETTKARLMLWLELEEKRVRKHCGEVQ
jgi:hypothetical protein